MDSTPYQPCKSCRYCPTWAVAGWLYPRKVHMISACPDILDHCGRIMHQYTAPLFGGCYYFCLPSVIANFATATGLGLARSFHHHRALCCFWICSTVPVDSSFCALSFLRVLRLFSPRLL
ncbi:hypothetical protein BDV59DRAFT_89816 [Aspergillus ambiguus]|uniref:uncharacterized protein n=1 Tax=Aspergillus ambiguus TaxID=176160 RepID=UPI003CCE001F